MTKTRILYVEQNIDRTVGGSHTYLLRLIEGQDPEKYECEVVFYEPNALCPKFEKYGPVFILDKPERIRGLEKLSLIRKAINVGLMTKDIVAIMKLMNHRKPDVVHLNNSFCVGYDTWGVACKLLRVPLFTFDRCYFEERKVKRAKRYINVFNTIMCSSDAVKDHYISLGIPAKKLTTVYDGIDAEDCQSQVSRSARDIRREFGLRDDQPVIGMVGNIRRWKGQHVVVNAVARLKGKVPNVHCLLIGSTSGKDEEYLGEIIRCIEELKLGNDITITGYRDDIPDILNSVDVQVHASIRPDPFPRVILEGMSLGLPIVASRSGGVVESILEGITGFLCKPGDDEEMAYVIGRLLEDVYLRKRMGVAALERVREFSMDKHVNKINRYYAEILNGRVIHGVCK